MKRVVALLLVAAALVVFSGCAIAPSPLPGFLFTEVKGPVGHLQAPIDAATHSRVGKATAKSFLGLVALGDASIEEAMRNGNIRHIHHVDYASKGILGIYAEVTVTVYGE
jgi:hypothetical protein